MKPQSLIQSTCAVLVSLLGSCVEPLPPGPALGGWQPPGRPNQPPADPSRANARDAGYRDGKSDATRGLTAEVLRHGAAYHRAGREVEWRAYSDGYSEAYGEFRRNAGGNRGGSNAVNSVREAYYAGYSKGRTDARNRRSFNENRYHYGSVIMPEADHDAFVQGYRDGFHGTALRY